VSLLSYVQASFVSCLYMRQKKPIHKTYYIYIYIYILKHHFPLVCHRYVPFAKYSLFYRAFLQERPMISIPCLPQVYACCVYIPRGLMCSRRYTSVASIGTLLKIIGFSCRIQALLQGSFCKRDYIYIIFRSLLIVATP